MFCVLNCRNVSNIYMKKLITIALTILPLFLSAQNDSVISNIYKRAGYDELYSELYKKDNWKKYFESKGMYKIDNSIYAQIDEYGYEYITSLSKEMPEELQKIYEEANDKGYNDANNDYLHIWFDQ